MSETVLIFLAGVAGSMHCLGMCGGFACALGADARGGAATLRRHLLYNLGRITTYCFAGAFVGQLGVLLVGHAGEGSAASMAQRGLALVSGLLMVLVGLQFLGVLGRLALPRAEAAAVQLGAVLRTLLAARGSGVPLALGVANGLLPCPLVYAFAAQAAASGGALPGLLTMAAFGLGTLPMMLLAGGVGLRLRVPPGHGGGRLAPTAESGKLASGEARIVLLRGGADRADRRDRARLAAFGPARRLLGVRVAGGFIVTLGLVTCARGLLPMSAHLHGL